MIIDIVNTEDHNYLYLPDKYCDSLVNLEKNFYNWIESQPSYIDSSSKNGGYVFDESAFLKFVNETILANYNEVAYFINDTKSKVDYRITL